MVEDVKQKIEEREQKKESAFANIPLKWKIVGLVIVLWFLYNFQTKGTLKQNWIYLVVVGLALYLLGKERVERQSILTEPEAIRITKDWLEEKKNDNQLSNNANIHILNNWDLKYVNSQPKFWHGGAIITYPDKNTEIKTVKVYVDNRLVCMQDALRPVTGREEPPVVYREGIVLKNLRKYGGDVKKWWF